MNYESMSDFEINKAVATLMGLDVSGATEDNNKMYDYVKNYCNSPSDAWPIIKLIFSKGVTLMINDTGVTTSNLGEKYNGKSLNVNCKPLRAAMIVFLMMNESE